LLLAPQQQNEFRWSVNTDNHFHIKIRVFTQESGDDIVIIKNPSEDSRIDAFFKIAFEEDYQPLVSVYLEKVVKVMAKEEGVFILLSNTHSVSVIVEVSLEDEPTKIDPALLSKNEHLQVPTVKMQAMLAEMGVTESNRKWRYKWEWGFL
jgi:hypothetical protein